METVVMVDVSQVNRIMNLSGVEGLQALNLLGDKFFFSDDALFELDASGTMSTANRPVFDTWLQEQINLGRLATVSPVTPDERSTYNPTNKNPTGEVWDMSARKYMLENPESSFKIFSDDGGMASHTILRGLGIEPENQVDFQTMKKAMINLTYDPNLDLSESQFNTIRSSNFQSVPGTGQGLLVWPESYQASLEAKENLRFLIEIGSHETVATIRKNAGAFGDGNGSAIITGVGIGVTGALISVLAIKTGSSPLEVATSIGIDYGALLTAMGEDLAQDAAVSGMAAAMSAWTGPGAPVVAAIAQIIRQGYNLYQSGEDVSAIAQTVGILINELSTAEFQAAVAQGVAAELQDLVESSNDFTSFVLETVNVSGLSYNVSAALAAVGITDCFLSGTGISMPHGANKPIEEIEVGDQVTSYDQNGNLVPGKVTRVFQNRVKHILDVFGLHVTPGHVTLCGDGPFAGRHVPMIDILRSDGALVRESGEKIRACTNEPVGSAKDRLIWAVTGEKQADGSLKVRDRGRIRLGTRFITAEGYDVSVADLIAAAHATVTPEGLIQQSSGGAGVPFFWSFTARLPRPEDYILQRSELQLNDIYQAAEWESVPPDLPRPSVAMA